MFGRRTFKPVASVVIPAYKSRDTIALCLSALESQETNVPYEVIVVESSGDGAGDVVRAQFPWVWLIESQERLLGGAARNLGAAEATGELLMFIDSDCVAEPRWLEKMHMAHQEWECSAVGGAILNGNPETASSVSAYISENSDFFPVGSPRYMDYLPSGNIAYRAEVFRKYAGFDPQAVAYQDLTFNKQLFKAGEKLLFHPDIKVWHHHRTTVREHFRHMARRGRAAVAARRKGLLIGASWVERPILAFLAAPGLFLRKGTVFPYRMLRAYPSQALSLLKSLPCFYAGLAAWHYGFLAEVVASRNTSAEKAEKCTTS